jgi:holo-[acyl-carrier protein] synthase
MIAGIGIDLVEVDKIARSIDSETYLRKVFTEAEIEECRSVSNAGERFAGKFAAKEAFMKAVGRGIRQGVWFTQIEVLNEASGAPYVRVMGEVEASLTQSGVKNIHVSVTHTKSTAAAVVILEQ